MRGKLRSHAGVYLRENGPVAGGQQGPHHSPTRRTKKSERAAVGRTTMKHFRNTATEELQELSMAVSGFPNEQGAVLSAPCEKAQRPEFETSAIAASVDELLMPFSASPAAPVYAAPCLERATQPGAQDALQGALPAPHATTSSLLIHAAQPAVLPPPPPQFFLNYTVPQGQPECSTDHTPVELQDWSQASVASPHLGPLDGMECFFNPTRKEKPPTQEAHSPCSESHDDAPGLEIERVLRKRTAEDAGFEVIRSPCDDGMRGGAVPVSPLSPSPRRRIRRYSTSTASGFCHICARSARVVQLAQCRNVQFGLCRKTVCFKCFGEQNWDWQEVIARPGEFWCSHCLSICPKNAQCRTYRRTNERRRQESIKQRRLIENALSAVGEGGR